MSAASAKPLIARYQMPSYAQVRCARCDDYISWPGWYVSVGEDIDVPSFHEDCARRSRITWGAAPMNPKYANKTITRVQMRPGNSPYRCTRCGEYICWPMTIVIVGEDMDSPVFHEDCAEREGIA